jgi:uncharacterized protein (UPF0276 family)
MIDLAALPRLGVGISAEHDSARAGIDALALRRESLAEGGDGLVDFLEYGGDVARGLDDHARRWAEAGLPVTYHFLDVNLEEREDVTDDWLAETVALARALGARWLCGDAGLWHFGPRDRGQEILLPPVLTRASADEMAEAIAHVQASAGMPCLPENPPSTFYLGDLHLLDYYAQVSDRAGCGLLLDCAHLAIFQRSRGLDALAGFDGYPLDRVVEVHIAGGTERETDGFPWVDDNHCPVPLEDAWRILEHVVARAPNLKAICYECERNPADEVAPGFTRLRSLFPAVRGSAIEEVA